MTHEPIPNNPLPPSHPFDDALCELAADLKSAGLKWTPCVGDFVWDPRAVINYPSPFPHRIYFILNINRFLDIFQTIPEMVDQLVWLPTWHQARAVCAALKIDNAAFRDTFCEQGGFEAGKDLDIVYRIMLSALGKDDI